MVTSGVVTWMGLPEATRNAIALPVFAVCQIGLFLAVIRFSAFLRQPGWLRLLYGLMALQPFVAVSYLIPFAGLLLAAARARKRTTVQVLSAGFRL